MEIGSIIENQRRFYQSGATRTASFRRDQLRKFRSILKNREQQIFEVLKADLAKPAFESYGSEVGFLYGEINHAIKRIPSWMKPRHVRTPAALFPSRSSIRYEPRGVVLIIAPWNYPFQLSFTPLIGALAAGNCAVLKPSELAPASSALIASIIREAFASEYVEVVEGGVETSSALLDQKFDYIFFTGGTKVGRIVAEAAAKQLIPCTLELGGKSPCIVDSDTNVEVAARRIAWGKFYNAGQNCVSPDYLIIPKGFADRFIKVLQKQIETFFGRDQSESADYGRIINQHHFERLAEIIRRGPVVAGGNIRKEDRYIEPTILYPARLDDPVMKEEIFGPILPVVEYDGMDHLLQLISERPYPLSLYVFSKNKDFQNKILDSVPFGGGCVNDTLVHLFNPNLPFGGIGNSGIGAYHGRYSFETFSHCKGIVSSTQSIDIPMRYPPYKDKLNLLRKIVK